MPKIAILMPTYNGEKYVEQQIDSILRQSIGDWHLYIRDDGSADSTVKIVRNKYAGEKNITIIEDNLGNLGVRKSYELLLNSISSDYYMFCDQDDVWLRDKIKISLDEILKQERLDTEPRPLLVHTDLTMTDENLKITADSYYTYWKERPSGSLNKNLTRCTVTGCTVIINRKLRDLYLKSSGPGLSSSVLVLHDYWLSIISSLSGRQIFIDKALVLYRRHSSNSSAVARNSLLSKINKLPYKIKLLKSIYSELKTGLARLLTENTDIRSSDKEILADFVKLTDQTATLVTKLKILLKNRFLYDTLPHNLIWFLSLI
jgi:rhamnosyltransferase